MVHAPGGLLREDYSDNSNTTFYSPLEFLTYQEERTHKSSAYYESVSAIAFV